MNNKQISSILFIRPFNKLVKVVKWFFMPKYSKAILCKQEINYDSKILNRKVMFRLNFSNF